VQSRAGLGKTREVAKLAARLCAEGWAVCVAKAEGNTRMAPPATFPDALRNNRLLFVLDDLHQRASPSVGDQKSYFERLDAFLAFLDRKLLPGEMYIIATARTEPHFRNELGFVPSQPSWGRFQSYDLPEFTLNGLQEILLRLADWRGVDIDKASVAQMVSNSDRTPRTLVENVKLAQQQGVQLTIDRWLPTQLSTWAELFERARQRQTEVEWVYKASFLIRAAGLPTRTEYVVHLGTKLANSDIQPAADELVNMGLLGLRSGLLDAFGDEQLQEIMRAIDKSPPSLDVYWEAIIEAIGTLVRAKPEWSNDLVKLSRELWYAKRFEDSESTATTAIDEGQDDAEVYYWRGRARFNKGNYAEAEADFTAVIERSQDSADSHYWRGFARGYQGNYAEAEADLTAAIQRGIDNTAIYYLRGMARANQSNSVAAEVDFTTAIIRGDDHPDDVYADLYYRRGRARSAQHNFAEAEADYTAAIERGKDDAIVYFSRALARFAQNNSAGAEADLAIGIIRGGDYPNIVYAAVYYLRGRVRDEGSTSAEVEADYTAAIERGKDDADVYYRRGLARLAQDNSAGAEADFTIAITRDMYDADNYYARGMVRANMTNNYVGAEADYTAAIERGLDDANVYYERARVRALQGNFAQAEADFSAAIERGKEEAFIYNWRAAMRAFQSNYAEAEADYTAAIERGRKDSGVYFGRGVTRVNQGNYAGAEADFTVAISQGRDDAEIYQNRAYANIRLERLEHAQGDCTQAEQHAPNDPITHACWGDLHLALSEYAEAIVRYRSALKAASDTEWHFELGLAFLLAGRFNEAKAVYEKGLSTASVPNIKRAFRELNFWTVREANRIASAEAREVIAIIRQQLEANMIQE
jgi:tetratricopeptide (TPR) repeat protein